MNSFAVKTICANCIGESHLKTLIQHSSVSITCSYCGTSMHDIITIGNLSKYVQEAFRNHFEETDCEPDGIQWIKHKDPDCDYSWEREGSTVEEIIRDYAIVDVQVASDIRECLDYDSCRRLDEYSIPREFDSEVRYARLTRYHHLWHEVWQQTELELKNQNRFFSQNVIGTFDEIFDNIDALAKKRNPVFRTFPKGKAFFRARVFQSDEKLKSALANPSIFLGSPVTTPATAGRMNAHGISVFYGSTKQNAAVAEVRPPVGSKVAVAKFKLLCAVRMLDLRSFATLTAEGSIFDARLSPKLSRVEFLRTFCEKITIPVMPENETFDYVITQAIADYLAGSNKFELDGIIYPSVQDQGSKAVNVVLFHKSAKCIGENDPVFDASLYRTDWDDDGYHTYPNYSLERKNETNNLMLKNDFRTQMLELDEDMLQIFHITGAKFTSDRFKVYVR